MHAILVGTPEGKRPLGKRKSRSQDNIVMDSREIMERSGLDQDRDQ
jgi:hypothetical protein